MGAGGPEGAESGPEREPPGGLERPALKIFGGGADSSASSSCGWEVGEMRCAACSKGTVIEIRMRIAGSEITFRRCARCESNTWEIDDGRVPLTRVLELARNG